MKVKIICSKKPTYWYADKVGKIFKVKEMDLFHEHGYGVVEREGKDITKWISVEDAEVVDELEQAIRKVGKLALKRLVKPNTDMPYEKRYCLKERANWHCSLPSGHEGAHIALMDDAPRLLQVWYDPEEY